MQPRSLFIEGSGKKIFQDTSQDFLVIEFKDYLIDKKQKKRVKVKNKGIINTEISTYLFEYLSSFHMPNHFVKKLADNEIKVKKLKMIPLKITIRNYASGKFCKKYGFKEGQQLLSPVLEFYLKNNDLKNPLMSESLIYALEIATKEEVLKIIKMACKTNAILKTYFERRNLKLAEIELEFGKSKDRIMLADELSCDTCILWDGDGNKDFKADKKLSLNAAYKLLYERIIGEN